VQGFNVQLKAD